MLIASFPAGPLQTNCYVVAREPGAECVIIDPGMMATESVVQIVEQQDLTPVAVILTHGHIDHVFSVYDLTERFGVPAWINDADRPMLSLAFDRLGMAELTGMCRQLSGGADGLTEPADVRSLPESGTQEFAGIEFTFRHAPGHTPGCTLVEIPYAEADVPIDRIVFSGDVLFAGSIGRTDLPGGDHGTMLRTLREFVLDLPDSAAVLSGHGGQTTIGRERATNPYLQENML
ncbi:MBL fold metallo-hydrolase [Ammonicoccus fulvus]|uniref:MBL fold metallo-hydrolase n=1 Tax=Ammonicoccus fulvus TaxID=3138240 RepID=A0ABZ3FRR8_9ACTN